MRKRRTNTDKSFESQVPQKKIPKCKICGEEFSNPKKLTAHRKLHKPPDLKQYHYTYNDEKACYSCNTCDVEFAAKEDVEKHIETHEEKFKCKNCHMIFNDPYKFCVHVYSHTKDEYKCPYCNFSTERSSSILSHINRLHLQKFPYSCRYCGKKYINARDHKEHESSHLSDEKQFECVVCQKKFAFSSYLHMHQVRFHRVNIDGILLKNQCEICRKVFSKAKTLQNHSLKHNKGTMPKPKTHLCDLCGKGYQNKSKLNCHYRVHTGYKPYKCKYCDKDFTKKDYLNMHERIHSGEKPYSCDFCGKCFNQSAPLRIHIRSHTGERPYVCHLCTSGFSSKGSLTIHLKSCEGI